MFCEIIKKTNKFYVEVDYKNLLKKFDNDNNSIILLVGQVQSGKTNAILEIIYLALTKYQYDIVFFLCGTNNNLKQQAINRIREYPKFNSDEFKIFDENNTYKYFEKLKWKKDKKSIVPILKEKSNLKKLYDIIDDNCSLFTNQKILIIDDESDYGSINTKKDDKSAINKLITNIHNKISTGGMVLVTATPYANILNTKDELKYSLKYIFPLKTNDGYTGIDFFSNLEHFYISENEYKNFLDSSLNDEWNEDDKKICYAFYMWIYKTYLFLKKYPEQKSTFLIYLSDFNYDHKISESFVKQLVKYFDDNIHYFENWLNYENIKLTNNEIDEIKNLIKKHFIDESNIYILNSKNDDVSAKVVNSRKIAIVIGGVMLSRGITYENLLTELILYGSNDYPTCDTLLQRCRWFGYRQKNERYKYMNVITRDDIAKYLKNDIKKYNNILFNDPKYELDKLSIYRKIKQLDDNEKLKATSYAKK